MEVTLLKSPAGALIPMTTEDAESLSRFKVGEMIRGKYTVARNGPFHRKVFSLLQLCYEKFSDRMDTGIEYKGQLVKPSFEGFREDFTILSGHFDVVFDINGKPKPVAKSLSFGKCNQEQMEKIYSDFINCALKHVYQGSMTEQQLRRTVDQILAYA